MLPALKPVASDTAFTGPVPRRIWRAPDLRSHGLMVLTLSDLYLTPPTGAVKAETVRAIEDGADLEECLGPLATTVALATVRRVKLDLLTNTLALEYMSGRHNTAQVAVVFATPEAADAAFTKIWRRLGESFELAPHKPDAWSVARVPVAFMAGVLVATAAAALTLTAAEDAVRVPGWADWRVVCGLGGAALAVVQVWLYRRLTRPPARLVLAPR